MAENLLGRLSGEELLQLMEQLDSNEKYFQDSNDENNNEISLDVGCNVEVEVIEQHDAEIAIEQRLNKADSTGVIQQQSASRDYSNQESDEDPNDPSYDPNDSVESLSDDDEETEDKSAEENRSLNKSNLNADDTQSIIDINNNIVSIEVNQSKMGSTEERGIIQTSQRRGRKRERRPENWARNIRQRKCSRGEKYINSRGKTVAERKMDGPCNCKDQCYTKLSETCRNRVFREFWAMGDQNKQNAYLFSMIEKVPVKRRRPTTGIKAEVRNFSYKYFILADDGIKSEVCSSTFQSLHGIGLKRVKRVRAPPTLPPENKRGKHYNRPNTIPQERIDQVKEHIQSFPRRQSHYSRADNPNKYYLHENLTIRRMWLLFLAKYEPEELQKIRKREKCSPKVKLWLYRKVFNTEFNLSFGMPRTDTCSKCDQLELSIRDAQNVDDQCRKSQLETEKEMHLRKAQGAYDNLKCFTKKAAEDAESDVYTFDFQQNLPVTCVTTSDLFYMRQLWTYNFGVHDLKTGDGIMHIWDESTAQRGSSEVCSCLEKTILSRHSQAQRLVLFSDGCSGQNKNRAMITFLASLCANPNKPYQRIDHFYLVRGHTYLPNDRDFALIERRKKGELPQVPKDYVKILKDSRTVQPFEVVEITGQEIKDYKVMGDKSMKPNMTSNEGEKVLIRSVMWFSYGASEELDPVSGTENLIEHHNEVWCRYTHNNLENWKKVKLFKRGVKPEKLSANQKYNGRICIKPAKYKDLNNLVERGLLSRQVAEFYQQLPCESAQKETENDSEYEDDYVE